MTGMNWESVWNVIKWILAALVAGFVGHFGRVLAERIISRRARKKEVARTPPPEIGLEKKRLKAQAKIEKKKAKAEIKRKKKQAKEE